MTYFQSLRIWCIYGVVNIIKKFEVSCEAGNICTNYVTTMAVSQGLLTPWRTGSDSFWQESFMRDFRLPHCMFDEAQHPGKAKPREFPTQYVSK